MKWLSVLWRGLVIGVADVIPGVSGGTIALLVGVYARFINALKQITLIPKYCWQLISGEQTFQDILDEVDIKFLVPLVFGMAVAIVMASLFVPHFMDQYPAPTYAFFIGLILAASIGLLRTEIQSKKMTFVLLGGFALGIGMGLLAPTDIVHSIPVLFISGALAVTAMLVPGISGSAVLLILGQYSYVLESLHRPLSTPVLVFAAGVLLGVFVTVRIISALLKKSRELTISALTGVMLGALLLPARSALPHLGQQPGLTAITAIIGLLLGGLLLLSGTAQNSQT